MNAGQSACLAAENGGGDGHHWSGVWCRPLERNGTVRDGQAQSGQSQGTLALCRSLERDQHSGLDVPPMSLVKAVVPTHRPALRDAICCLIKHQTTLLYLAFYPHPLQVILQRACTLCGNQLVCSESLFSRPLQRLWNANAFPCWPNPKSQASSRQAKCCGKHGRGCLCT